MFDNDGFLKLLFVVTWLNVFVILEPFINKDGYRTIIFAKDASFRTRLAFFGALNVAFLLWALVMTARV